MSVLTGLKLKNAQVAPMASLNVDDVAALRTSVIDSVKAGGRLASFFGYQLPDGGPVRLVAVVARDGALDISAADLMGDSYGSLTPDLPEAHWFEREIAEQWGVTPEGHPWPKPIRFHGPYRKGHALPGGPRARAEPSVMDFFAMGGEEVHEVAVGPVHAGVIEPGHFRFQCHGETVFHLEISLGYQHRGIEPTLAGGPGLRTIHQVETLAGDTTVAHAWAYSHVVEALSGVQPSTRTVVLRGIALELERLANHIIDLGALAGDIGFLPTLNYCGRLRAEALNSTTMVCGNRMGRGWVRPGGMRFDIDPEMAAMVRQTIDAFERDAENAVNLLWDTPTVMARFEGVGTVSAETARALGLVGVAARASGLRRDARAEFAAAPYSGFEPDMGSTGDVYARAHVRWLEVMKSCELIRFWLDQLPPGNVAPRISGRAMAPESIGVGIVEGWRGEVVHVAITGPDGRLVRYKIVDPSFHNWQGLAVAMRDQAVSDFPLCNKSFNLSYCGHDL